MFERFKGRKLYRKPKDGLLVGVAAGLAEYLGFDPVFVRLGLVLLALLTYVWPVALAYLIAAFLMPVDPAQEEVPPRQKPKDITDAHRGTEA